MSNAVMNIVNTSRKPSRPTALEFIHGIFKNFIQFYGDRYFKDDPAVIGGIATLAGRPVTVIGIQKGHDLQENINRNFGQPNPEGYRKSLRLMKQAEKFGRPVITLVNTSGAFCGVEAEERGQGAAIANNILEMSVLKVPIISIIIGEAGSGGALALCVSDKVWMLQNSIYSILSPEGYASILWKDASKAEKAAQLMKLTANELLQLEVIDKIIAEPENGVDIGNTQGFKEVAKDIKESLIAEINQLSQKDVETLLNERYQRFRKFGAFEENLQ